MSAPPQPLSPPSLYWAKSRLHVGRATPSLDPQTKKVKIW